jgi:hypothetical protein
MSLSNHKIDLHWLLYAFLILSLLSSGCNKKIFPASYYRFKSSDGQPHYEQLAYWASHPQKWDPADSVPKPFRKNGIPSKNVDVFFIHPTTFTDAKNNNWNANIDDSLLNLTTDKTTILYQASVFNEATDIYAPRYRQAHLRAFFDDNKLKAALSFDKAYADVKAAFSYYLKNNNNGHAIIIASHSQGTLHAGRLLKDFFEKKPLMQQLLAVYAIGMPIPTNYFITLKKCETDTACGCYVGWRSFRKGYSDSTYIGAEKFVSDVTNPITWRTDSSYAPRQLHKGGILKNFNRVTKPLCDAQIKGNILWISRPKFFGARFIKNPNYHIGDINLFYGNIRHNVAKRIEQWQKRKSL